MLRSLTTVFAAAGFLVSSLILPVQAADEQPLTPAQKSEVEGIVKDYLLGHPEILEEMVVKLQEQRKIAADQTRQKTLTEQASDIFRSPGDFVAGNPQGKVTIVEFFDYNCGWCKRGFPEILALVEGDKDLRLVLKELPIFGEASDYAAKAALASEKQGKYWEFHQALFKATGKLTVETVDETATSVGIDLVKLKKDMEDPAIAATLAKNDALARALDINGTPAFIVGDKLIPGYVSKDEMTSTVEDVRKRDACKHC